MNGDKVVQAIYSLFHRTITQSELLPFYRTKIGACYEKSNMSTDKKSNDDNRRTTIEETVKVCRM